MKRFLLSLLLLGAAFVGRSAAPIAQDGAANGNEDASIISGSVSATDPENDPLTYSLVDNVASDKGTLTFNTDGTFDFTPAADFFGTATFTYQASDGTSPSNIATVTITVAEVNDAPSFLAGGDQQVDEDAGAQTVPNWATNISAGPNNESGQNLTFIVTNTNNSLFSVQPTIDANGNLKYTPAENAFGVATVSIKVKDDGGTANGGVNQSAVQTFTLTINGVNDAPAAGSDGPVVTDEDVPVTVDVLVNDTDADGDALTIQITSTTNGTATVSNGQVVFTPTADFAGTANFKYRVKDPNGATSSTVTVTVNVAAVNDAPAAGQDGPVTTNEDVFKNVDVLVNDTDPEADALSIQINGATNGTATVSGAQVKFTPAANFNGAASFKYQAKDANGGLSNEITVTVNVTAVNDAPVVTTPLSNVTVAEDATNTVIDLSSTFSDVDGDALTISVLNSNTGLLSATYSSSTKNLTLNYGANKNGSATITVTANDGNGGTVQSQFTVNVTATNDAPSFTKGADQTKNEDAGAQSIPGWATDISAGPSDESGQTLSFSVTNNNNALFSAQPAIDASGKLTYTPAANASGSATVTITLSDNGSNSAPNVNISASQTFTITINAVNDAPVAGADNGPYTTPEDVPITIDVLANDNDVDDAKASLTIQLGATTNGSTTVTNGKVVFTPALDFNGAATFKYKAKDPSGALSNEITVTVNVTPVFDAADRSLVLNELYIDPNPKTNQFFELYNTSTSSINLNCYSIVAYSKTGPDLYVIDLPNVTLAGRSWFVGAGSATPKAEGTPFTPDFNWNAGVDALAAMGASFTKYTKTGATSYDVSPVTNPNTELFYNYGSNQNQWSIFLFSSGFYVNGFISGQGNSNVGSPFNTFPTLTGLTNGCGTFDINMSGVTRAEYINQATGSNHGYYRKGDGTCGQWDKMTAAITPGTANPTASAAAPIITSAEKILCSSVAFSVSAVADAGAYPITVELYYDKGTPGVLDNNDELQGGAKTIANAQALTYSSSFPIPAGQKVLIVYRTALGCVSKIAAPTSTPELTTTQYNLCNQQFGAAITTADAVTSDYGFPVTVNFYNTTTTPRTLIGTQQISSPSATIVYSTFTGTVYDPAKISVEYVPKNTSCLQTVAVPNTAGTLFALQNGTDRLTTIEQFRLNTPNVTGSPGRMYVKVTGLIAGTFAGYNNTNLLPVTANLYWDKAPAGPGGDVFIGSVQIGTLNQEYQIPFNITKAMFDANSGSPLVVTYTANYTCVTARKEAIAATILPVHFKSFTATRKEDKVLLKWETATEQNNKGFYVQRNTGGEWKDVAFVFAQSQNGNSTSDLGYSFTDLNPAKGVTHYRILQVDLDGSGHYSELRSVHGKGSTTKLLLFPNPSSTGAVTLVFDSESARTIVVSDLSGRTVQQVKTVVTGSYVVKNLSAGFYTVQVTEATTGTTSTEKFIITKR